LAWTEKDILTRNYGKGNNVKILLPVVSVVVALFLLSCQEREESTDVPVSQQVQAAQPQPQKVAAVDVHTVKVQEVIQGESYTYLKVDEKGTLFWVAISKTDMEVGETISFRRPLEMRNFTSKELERTFETIYFVGGIDKESSPVASEETPKSPHQKPAVEAKDTYAGKVVRVKGHVTKVNLGIMGKNWVHLQDGTGDSGSNDLLVTTQHKAALGDIVVFEGTIALNKDFGSGYSYELLMEEAKRQTER
jgi:hypothetical protein